MLQQGRGRGGAYATADTHGPRCIANRHLEVGIVGLDVFAISAECNDSIHVLDNIGRTTLALELLEKRLQILTGLMPRRFGIFSMRSALLCLGPCLEFLFPLSKNLLRDESTRGEGKVSDEYAQHTREMAQSTHGSEPDTDETDGGTTHLEVA